MPADAESANYLKEYSTLVSVLKPDIGIGIIPIQQQEGSIQVIQSAQFLLFLCHGGGGVVVRGGSEGERG